jgi:hypothetical protein
MEIRFVTIVCLAIMLSTTTVCATPDNLKRLKPLQVVTGVPETSLRTLKTAFSKEAIVPWSIIAVSTIGLYAADREMLDEVQHWGRSTGVGNSDNTKTVLEAGPYPLFRFPSDTGSALYYLGDGWTHFTIAGSFLLAGQMVEGNRPHNTGLEIIHGMVVSTIFSQILKRSTGRESPSQAHSARGAWRPFPSPSEYNRNTARYDAFPSGHVMTATLTFTVINTNYPEYRYYTIPLAGVWLTALGLQMMNNGVHWASDYPLGVAMGYLVGKLSAQLGEPDENGEKVSAFKPLVFPGRFAQTDTLNLLWTF